MSALKDSDAVAEALREDPPRLDDLAKARMERRLLEAARGPRAPKAAEPSRRGVGRWVAGGLAVAAAVAVAVLVFRESEPTARIARMELRSASATRQSGTIDEGSSLRTRADETAEIRVEDSVVHLEPSTEVRIETLSADRMAFALSHGEVRVEFHPRARGHEGMTVRTGRATVEVVGTDFTVRETAPATEVTVTEGVVRVVPLGGEARAVAAGESTRVADERRAEAVAEPVAPHPEEEAPAAPEAEASPPPQTERERRAQSPAQRLARARRLVAEGDNAGAEALLRGVIRASDATASIRAQAATLLGDLLQRGGDLPGAAEAYETAARQHAGHLSHLAIYDLARMQDRRMNDRDAARASYRRYLDESGNGPLAGQARQALCRLGDASTCPEAEPTP